MQIAYLRCGPGLEFYTREYPSFPFELDGLRFTADATERADWLVQSSAEIQPVQTTIARSQRILVISEPSGNFPADYVNQFSVLVSPFRIPGFSGIWRQSHGALPSFFGMEHRDKKWSQVLDFEGINSLQIPDKQDIVSAVVSGKSVLPGHRARLRFISLLKTVLGERLDVHGRGNRDIADKADAILSAKYHLVLENTIMPSYWTEKLADAWLGYAFPLVSGPPDLARWFPRDSFLSIDISRPAEAIDNILQTMDDDLFSRRIDAIHEARRRILHVERLCMIVARFIADRPNGAAPLTSLETIDPPPRPNLARRISREVARFYWQTESRLRS